jgi:hypothetical protein
LMGWFKKAAPAKEEAPKKKICCACPETKVDVIATCSHCAVLMRRMRQRVLTGSLCCDAGAAR